MFKKNFPNTLSLASVNRRFRNFPHDVVLLLPSTKALLCRFTWSVRYNKWRTKTNLQLFRTRLQI